eukprot:COSAG05_NODE_5887_length_1065_cov_408.938923_2_plen_39_part_01
MANYETFVRMMIVAGEGGLAGAGGMDDVSLSAQLPPDF